MRVGFFLRSLHLTPNTTNGAGSGVRREMQFQPAGRSKALIDQR